MGSGESGNKGYKLSFYIYFLPDFEMMVVKYGQRAAVLACSFYTLL